MPPTEPEWFDAADFDWSVGAPADPEIVVAYRELEEFCGRRRDGWYIAAVVVVAVLAVIGLLALLDAAMGAVVSAGLLD